MRSWLEPGAHGNGTRASIAMRIARKASRFRQFAFFKLLLARPRLSYGGSVKETHYSQDAAETGSIETKPPSRHGLEQSSEASDAICGRSRQGNRFAGATRALTASPADGRWPPCRFGERSGLSGRIAHQNDMVSNMPRRRDAVTPRRRSRRTRAGAKRRTREACGRLLRNRVVSQFEK